MEKPIEALVVIREFPYWVSDENLPKARARFKRLTGKLPTSKARINVFAGTYARLDKITVNDMGDISYPKELTMVVIQP